MRQITPKFGAEKTTVNAAMGKSLGASMEAQNILNSDTGFIDFGKITREAAQLTTNILDTKKTVQSNEAKQHYIDMVSSKDYINASDTNKAEMFENFYTNMGEQSKAYQNAFSSYSANEFIRASTGRETETTNAYYRQADAAKTNYLTENDSVYDANGILLPEYKGITDDNGVEIYPETKEKRDAASFVEYYMKQRPSMDKVVLNRALLFGMRDEVLSTISLANTPEELNEALQTVKEIEEPFQSNHFLTTKSTAGKSLITELNNQKKQMITAKQSQFKSQAYTRIATAEDSGYRIIPEAIKEDIFFTSDNILSGQRAYKTYVDNYNLRTEADNYTVSNPIGQRTQAIPDNKLVKEEREESVTATLVENFTNGNNSFFIQVATNEAGMAKKGGEELLLQFNNIQDPKDLSSYVSHVVEISKMPKGARAIRQTIGDEGYVDILTTHYLASSIYSGDVVKARNYVYDNDRVTTKKSMNSSMAADMKDITAKLGLQADAFNAVIQRMHNISPGAAEKHYKDIAKIFLDTTETSGGVKFNKSMGDIPSSAIAPEKIVENIITEHTKQYGGNPTEVSYVGNSVFTYDAYGGTATLQDLNSLVEKTDAVEIEMARQEAIEKKRAQGTILGDVDRVVTDILPEIVLGVVPQAVTGFVGGVSNMLNNIGTRFGAYMWQQTLKDIETVTGKDFNTIPTIEQDAIMNQLEQEKKSIMTTMPEVDRMTMPTFAIESMKQAVMKNNIKKSNIDFVIKEVGKTKVSEYIGGETYEKLVDREGNKEASYKDSRGFLTAGIGHKLSKEEQKKYPEGTIIPQSVRYNWLKEDVKEAKEAAIKQAKEIGNPKLEEALVHVNFQLGPNWAEKFNESYPLLKKGKIEEVIVNLKKSLWMKQTPTRVNDFIAALRKEQ